MTSYCWEKAAAQVPAHLILTWPLIFPPLFKSFCLSFWHPLTKPLRTGGETDGGEGLFLKGNITVSPEDVHNHSAKQIEVGRDESTFSLDFFLEFLAPCRS